MAKQKSHKHEGIIIYIKYTCPVTHKEIELPIGSHDISASEQECELCGSHGEISISFHCPECGEFHEHQIRTW